MTMKKRIKAVSIILALVMLISLLPSCGGDEAETDTISTETEKTETTAKPETETEPETEEDTEPEYINPLTGLAADSDVSLKRPVGVMINNIYEALPQVGIGGADVIFECLAEGGITRLFALFSEYDKLGVIGSVRSSRPYYLDFAQMFDAIYVHAGGSEDAYSDIWYRGINNIDGVRGDPLGIYYRDETRMQTMAIEHTLMTTGDGIIKTIEYCGYRTDLRDGYEYPFKFCEWGETYDDGGEECLGIHIPISWYQTVDYAYDATEGVYLRSQYNGTPHVDGADGKQLSFTNVIVLFCNTYAYDGYGRLKVETTGQGDGYLATNGKYVPIVWQRDSIDGNLTLLRADDQTPIMLNRGKTFINVCPTSVYYEINMNSK